MMPSPMNLSTVPMLLRNRLRDCFKIGRELVEQIVWRHLLGESREIL